MTADQMTESAATVIIGLKVLDGCDEDFLAWQHELNNVAAHYPGFLGAEVNAPTATQPEWVVVYRFDSVANLGAWLNSAARQERLSIGRRYLDGPATQQVVSGQAKAYDQLVTVMVSHRVDPEHVAEFLAWQDRLRLAESNFSGYRGSELFRPIEGLQDEWTALYRYDTAADLDAWLTSGQRRELLAEGRQFHDFQLRTIDNSFGSWFAFDEHGADASSPSEFKTSIAVWVGLYPTVVLLTLALSPLRLPLWLNLLVGNLVSSLVMSFVTMPYYVIPLLKRWLQPPKDVARKRIELRGIAVITAVMVGWTAAIYLVTSVFWSLP